MDEDEWKVFMQHQTPPSDLTQWQACLDSLEPSYNVAEWMRQLKQDGPEQKSDSFNPYFKIGGTSETSKRSSMYQDENGNLHSWNISAYQIPTISLTEEISGTVYTVTGSFEGSQNMLRKLERITAQKFSAEMGEDA